MDSKLRELIEDRKDFIRSARKNNMYEGIRATLINLYPDTAHFIYELLQNAEDVKATTVRFTLMTDRLEFEHNGTRNFTIEDIDSITNMGNSTKLDEPTTIGKFGIGFKAVYAYTATPEIHSGDYHFRIRDMLLPEVDDVIRKDTYGGKLTKFYFPFNEPKKPKDKAYKEILTGLAQLDESSILFLRNIKKIEYSIENSCICYVKKAIRDKHYVEINCKKYFEKEATSLFLKFDRQVEIIDENNDLKNLNISVAYKIEEEEKEELIKTAPKKIRDLKAIGKTLEESQKGVKLKKLIRRIVPIEGKTFIFFPAEKEYSGLRFHIHAPFASTAARDSVKSSEDNDKLKKDVALLVADSMKIIKDDGLLTVDFLNVLPNNGESTDYCRFIFKELYEVFHKYDLLPSKDNNYVCASRALKGNIDISNLFSNQEISSLLDNNFIWIKNPMENTYADRFIKSLNVYHLDYSDFFECFDDNSRYRIEELVENKDNPWLKKFYELCSVRWRYINEININKSKIIKCSKGKFYKPSEIYISENTKHIPSSIPIVEPIFLTDKVSDIKILFEDYLEIRGYGENIEIEKMLDEIEKSRKADDDYYAAMLIFAEYSEREKYQDVDFSSRAIFLFKNYGNLCIGEISGLFLGKDYGNENYYDSDLLNIFGLYCLDDSYKERYKGEELELFISFVRRLKIKERLIEIQKVSCHEHPLFYKELYKGGNVTAHKVSHDYNIRELEYLLRKYNFQINREIWRVVLDSDNYEYTRAEYSPNSRADYNRCDSSLVYYLKKYKWVPDKDGNMFKPEDIWPVDIHEDFYYYPNNKILKSLNFGSALEKSSQELTSARKLIEDSGGVVIPREEAKEFEEYKRKKEAKARALEEKNKLRSAQELLKMQNRDSTYNEDDIDDYVSDGIVYNKEKREKSIENTFKTRTSNIAKKLFRRIAESTKGEKIFLQHMYGGECQICSFKIRRYDGVPHFVAINIINTKDLPDDVRSTIAIGWNSLSLCPNCAAKYKVCKKDLDSFYSQIMGREVIEGEHGYNVLQIELDGEEQDITFKPKHFLALKKAVEILDNNFKSSNSNEDKNMTITDI